MTPGRGATPGRGVAPEPAVAPGPTARRREPRHRRVRPSAPPVILDPIFALIEQIDRRRRRIRMLRDGGVLGVEVRRYRGRPIALHDGTTIRAGDRIVDLHLDNRRIASVWEAGWRATFSEADADLRACAAWLTSLPPDARPVALRSGGLLTVGAARVGFEVGPPRGGFMGRLESWYLRGLLVRWSHAGRSRLDQGHEPLRSREAWLPTTALLARFGGPLDQGSATSSRNGPSDRPARTRRSGPNGPRPRADSE